MNWPKPSTHKETFSGNTKIETIQIDSLDELKQTLWVDKLIWINEEFKKPLKTTKEEILKMKEEIARNETSLKLKEFLNAQWIIWTIWEKFKKANESYKEKIKPQEAIDSMEDQINDLWWQIDKATSTKAKKALTKVKEKATEEWFLIMIEKWQKSDNFLLKLLWWFLWFFAWLALFWTKVDDLKEKANDLLSPEEVEKTKIKLEKEMEPLLKNISKKFPDHPVIQKNLKATIHNKEIFTPEVFAEIQELMNEWKTIDFKTFRSILKWEQLEKFNNSILTPEAEFAVKSQAEARIVQIIHDEYNLELNSEKRAKLISILDETKEDIDYIELLQSFLDWEEKDWFDFLWASIGTWVWLFWFSMKLVTNWIVGAWNLALNIQETWVKTVTLWLWKLWFNSITYQDFEKQLEKMNEAEKGLLLWTLYRKTWLFSRILWKITHITAKWLVDIITPTSVNSIKAFKDWINWDIPAQIKNYELLAKKLWWNENHSKDLKDAHERIRQITENAEIIQILNECEKNNLSPDKVREKLLNKNFEFTKDFSGNSLDEIRENLSKNINPKINHKASRFIKTIYPWMTSAINDFYSNITTISNFQKASIRGWLWYIDKASIWIKKYHALIKEMEISRKVDKMIFEWLSKEKILSKTQALKKFAQDMPDLFKHTFGWLAEIAFIGLSFSSKEADESWVKTILNDLMYMSWLIWPLALTLNAWAVIDKDTKEVKWLNIATAWAWTVFLAMDAVTTVRIFGTNPPIQALKKVWVDVIARPITASYKAISNLTKAWKNIVDITQASWKLPWWQVWKKSLDVLKKWAKSKTTMILALAGITSYAAINYFKVDLSKQYEYLIENKIIDEQWNILNEKQAKIFFANNFSQREKEVFIEVLFSTQKSRLVEPASCLEFDIDWDTLKVITEKQYVWDWVINPEIKRKLKTFWLKEIVFINNYKKTA